MRCTRICQSPVLTLFSSSPSLSWRAQAALCDLFGMASRPEVAETEDPLDSLFQHRWFRKQWHSCACECKVSGTIIHFLSIHGSSVNRKSESMSILSIAGSDPDHSVEERVRSARSMLAKKISHQITRITMLHSMGRPLLIQDISGTGGGLPLLDQLDSFQSSGHTSDRSSSDYVALREVALPHFDEATYSSGQSLLSTLADARLLRPVIGLYLVQDTLALRPLPAARQDRVLPLASLIFSCSNLDNIQQKLTPGAHVARIGFNGTSQQQGQLMVVHPDLPGLSLRFTDSLEYSSSFAEAQDALLAGSLRELQNQNVLLEGGVGRHERSKLDTKDGEGDCWIEFRATLKQPWGFLRRHPTKTNTAKVPDIPFE